MCQCLPGAQEGTDRFSALLQLSWGDSWLEVSCVFGRAGEERLLGEQEREGREKRAPPITRPERTDGKFPRAASL